MLNDFQHCSIVAMCTSHFLIRYLITLSVSYLINSSPLPTSQKSGVLPGNVAGCPAQCSCTWQRTYSGSIGEFDELEVLCNRYAANRDANFSASPYLAGLLSKGHSIRLTIEQIDFERFTANSVVGQKIKSLKLMHNSKLRQIDGGVFSAKIIETMDSLIILGNSALIDIPFEAIGKLQKLKTLKLQLANCGESKIESTVEAPMRFATSEKSIDYSNDESTGATDARKRSATLTGGRHFPFLVVQGQQGRSRPVDYSNASSINELINASTLAPDFSYDYGDNFNDSTFDADAMKNLAVVKNNFSFPLNNANEASTILDESFPENSTFRKNVQKRSHTIEHYAEALARHMLGLKQKESEEDENSEEHENQNENSERREKVGQTSRQNENRKSKQHGNNESSQNERGSYQNDNQNSYHSDNQKTYQDGNQGAYQSDNQRSYQNEDHTLSQTDHRSSQSDQRSYQTDKPGSNQNKDISDNQKLDQNKSNKSNRNQTQKSNQNGDKKSYQNENRKSSKEGSQRSGTEETLSPSDNKSNSNSNPNRPSTSVHKNHVSVEELLKSSTSSGQLKIEQIDQSQSDTDKNKYHGRLNVDQDQDDAPQSKNPDHDAEILKALISHVQTKSDNSDNDQYGDQSSQNINRYQTTLQHTTATTTTTTATQAEHSEATCQDPPPSFLSLLTQLETLHLQGERLRCTINGIASLRSLVDLTLANMALTVEDFSSENPTLFDQLINLEILTLNDNLLNSLPNMQKALRVHTLSMENNLMVIDNKHPDWSALPAPPSLENLDLRGNNYKAFPCDFLLNPQVRVHLPKLRYVKLDTMPESLCLWCSSKLAFYKQNCGKNSPADLAMAHVTLKTERVDPPTTVVSTGRHTGRKDRRNFTISKSMERGKPTHVPKVSAVIMENHSDYYYDQ